MTARARIRAALLGIFAAASLVSCTAEPPDTADAGAGIGAGPFNNPRAIAEEPGGDLIVADFSTGHIFRVDGETGDRELLSDNANPGQGPEFLQPAGVTVLSGGRIFVADLGLNAVIEVDPVAGTRTLFAGGDGIAIRQPFGITWGRLGGKEMLVVADTGSPQGGRIIGPTLIDPDSGEITRIPVPDGNSVKFNDPRSVVVHEGRGTILAGNFGVGSIVEIDPVSGTRRMISVPGDNGRGSGPGFVSITDMVLSRDGDSLIVVDLGREALISVDLESGDRTLITQSFGEQVGSGFDFLVPHGIAIVEQGYMITDFGAPGVIFVDRAGNRSVFSTTPVKGFGQIRGIHVLADGNIVAADFAGERVFLVDPVSGERSLISGSERGAGPSFNGPVSVEELNATTLAVAEFSGLAIFSVDRATGDRGFLTGPGTDGRGDGPALGSRGIIVDPNNRNRILATDFALDAVVEVDIPTGNRRIFSSAITDTPRGAGPALNNPFGIDIADDGTIYVSDMGLQAVAKIDAEGNRTIVSSNDGTGAGPKFASPWGIRFIDDVLYVADGKGIFRIDLATGDRELVSPGGPIFTLRKLGTDRIAVSSIAEVNGIEVSDMEFRREVLSNASHPEQ